MLWDTLQTVTLLPCQLEHDERIFFFKRFQLLYGNLCTAITRSFRSGTEQPTVSAWKKKEFSVRRSDPLLWLFLMTFWFASRRLFTGLRGSSSFRIVLLLSLDCNIKRMHPAFWIVNLLLASSHPAIQSDTNAFPSSLNYYTSCSRSFSRCRSSNHQAHSKSCLCWSVKNYFRITFFLTPIIFISFGANSSKDSKWPVRWGWMWRRGINFNLYEQLYIINVSCNAGPLRPSSCVPWCYGILDSWCVILSSFQILIDNLCCRWKVSILQVSPFNFF